MPFSCAAWPPAIRPGTASSHSPMTKDAWASAISVSESHHPEPNSSSRASRYAARASPTRSQSNSARPRKNFGCSGSDLVSGESAARAAARRAWVSASPKRPCRPTATSNAVRAHTVIAASPACSAMASARPAADSPARGSPV